MESDNYTGGRVLISVVAGSIDELLRPTNARTSDSQFHWLEPTHWPEYLDLVAEKHVPSPNLPEEDNLQQTVTLILNMVLQFNYVSLDL